MRTFCYFLSALLFILTVSGGSGATQADESVVSIKGTSFKDFYPADAAKRQFGSLNFKGGTYLFSTNRQFGGFSGLHILDGGRRLLAVSDTGNWLKADIKRGTDGAIHGLDNGKMGPLYSGKGPRHKAPKYFVDAEALVVSKDEAFIAYESINEIARYNLKHEQPFLHPELLKLPSGVDKVSSTKGLEALALGREKSALSGHLVAISERGKNRRDASFGWIVKPDGPSEKEGFFRVARDNLFDITDAIFLKNGNLLLLERRFTIADGVAMRFREIEAQNIVKGAHLKGNIIMQADFTYRLDNMEGLSLYENGQGEMILAVISDDNHSLLQRTILMEFVLEKE